MRKHFTILMLLFLTACKTEFRKTIEKYPNGKVSIEYVYPDKRDTTKFTYVAYYENGDTMFKSQVKEMKFVGQKTNYFDNGKIADIETLFKPTDFGDSLYDCYIQYFSPNGKPLKSLYYKNGVKAFPAKYWLDNGITLTGRYYDSNHTTVLWQWFDKNSNLLRQKKDTGKSYGFSTPFK
jgi:antitoxin component YwqK of YwqJK toxin-antitoxin module